MNALLLIVAVLGLVEPAPDLDDLGREARAQDLPIVLYVSRSDCTFCRRMETDVLAPLLKSGALDGNAVVRELVSDASEALRDFRGTPSTPLKIAESYDARLTPVFLFLDSDGAEIAPRLTGYNGSEYYSFYLERAVEKANATLRARAR